MVRLVRAEKMVLSGLVFARKIARMILIQNIQGLMGPLVINMAFMPLYMWEMWDVTPVTHEHTDEQWKVVQYSVWAESAKDIKFAWPSCLASQCRWEIERRWPWWPGSGWTRWRRARQRTKKVLPASWLYNSSPIILIFTFVHVLGVRHARC